MVLATDLKRHYEFISRLKSLKPGALARPRPPSSALAPAAASDESAGGGRLDTSLALEVAIKFCDLGHVAKPWAQHERWTSWVTEEMFVLGDSERRSGCGISALCDREKDTSERSRGGCSNAGAATTAAAAPAPAPAASAAAVCHSAKPPCACVPVWDLSPFNAWAQTRAPPPRADLPKNQLGFQRIQGAPLVWNESLVTKKSEGTYWQTLEGQWHRGQGNFLTVTSVIPTFHCDYLESGVFSRSSRHSTFFLSGACSSPHGTAPQAQPRHRLRAKVGGRRLR